MQNPRNYRSVNPDNIPYFFSRHPFNSVRTREYDGSHINFGGISPEIELKPHQLNAIAHILYGGNTLLAHVVGAGKTFEMTAAAMESKRLSLWFSTDTDSPARESP